jgi:hypothetical protein
LAANDDSDVGASTNSRLRFLAPSSGVYFVSVRGTIAKIAGDYELLVRPRKSTVAPCNIQLGQTIKSDLEDIEDSKNYARSCFFSGQSGQRVSIAMNAAEFDSVLELRHGDRLIASDDDSGGGQNALLVKTLPATGTYEIRATTLSLESKKQVGFTLSLNALKQPKSVVEIDHVTVGTAETGRFTDDNVVGPDERPYALYQLSGRAREGFIVLVDWTDPAMQKARVGTLRLQVGANTPIGFASARASTASPINPLTIPINFDTDGTLLLRISSTPGRQGEYRLSVSRQVESTGVAGPS